MTIEHTVGCCSCGVKPCLGDLCPNLQPYEQIVCDNCKEETDVYEYDGAELCMDCIWKDLPKSKEEFCSQCGEYENIKLLFGKSLCKVCAEEKLQESGCHVNI